MKKEKVTPNVLPAKAKAEKQKVVMARAKAETHVTIACIAKEHGLDVSSVVRWALNDLFEKLGYATRD